MAEGSILAGDLGQKLGPQPRAIWVLSAVFALSMWGFANLFSSLTLYLTQVGYGLKNAYDLYACFAALIWVIPLLGGFLAQYLGYVLCSYVGLFFSALAMLGLGLHTAQDPRYFLALYLVGNGFFVPSLWCLIDHLYSKAGQERRIGFTYFYVVFNLGGVLGIFIGGFLATLSTVVHVDFIVDAGFVGVAMLLLAACGRFISSSMVRPLDFNVVWSRGARLCSVVAAMLIISALVLWLLQHHQFGQPFLLICIVGGVAVLLYVSSRQPNKAARYKIYAFMALSVAAFLFWSLYNLEPSLLSVFADRYVNRHFGTIVVPATIFLGFACLTAVVAGLLLNKYWKYRAIQQNNMGLLARFSVSLMLMGCGYLYLMVLIQLGHAQAVSMYMFAFSYVLFTCGELFIGPLGISMAGELSPQGQEGLFMGLWQLTVGVSAVLSDFLAKNTVPTHIQSLLQGLHVYGHFFMWIGMCSVVFAGLFLLLSFRFDRWLANLKST